MERLRPALMAYHLNTLEQIAETLGIRQRKPVNKQRLIDDLYLQIQKFAGSADFIRSLSDVEKEVLKLVLELDRVCTHRDVTLPLIKQGNLQIRGVDATAKLPTINTVLGSLLSKGLLLNMTPVSPDEDQRQFEPLVKFGIPSEVQSKIKRHLSSVMNRDISKKFINPSSPLIIIHRNLDEILRRLFFVWSELRSTPARLLKSGVIGKRDLRRIASNIGFTDDEFVDRLQLFYAVLKALNLVAVKEGTVEAVDNSAVTLFWNSNPVSQVREILSVYPQIDIPVEYDSKPLRAFAYSGGVKPRSHPEIRKIILDILEHLSTTSWIPYSLFFALASGGLSGHLVLPTSSLQLFSNALKWYGISRRTEFTEQLYDIEQEIVLSVLDEFVSLGFIDFGYGQFKKDTPDVVQVSDLLRAFFMQQPMHESLEQGQVILQPDAQLLAMGPVPLHVLANLERVAVREKHDPSVIAYRITREGIYRALQRGESLFDIRGYLEDATGQPLPQNISRSLDEWSEQHERIVVHRDIQILQTVSLDTMDQLMRDTILSQYLHRLDDKTAWIRQKDAAHFEKRLRVLNILPARSVSREGDLVNSLRWEGDQLVSRLPLPSHYVIREMQLIAAQSEGDSTNFQWNITEDRIKQCLANGYQIIDIIKTIEKMTGSPLPLHWQKKLKAWGKYYGDGHRVQVHLIHLENHRVLQELRAVDRNLHEWLQPLPHTESLAVVRQMYLEETLRLLASYGVIVRESEWW